MTREEMIAALESALDDLNFRGGEDVACESITVVLAALRATPEGMPQTAAPVTPTREQLLNIEWGGVHFGHVVCPACDAMPENGHSADCWLAAALSAAPPASGVSVPVEAVEGITVAGARAFWALKDLETRHESLRVAVMTAVSDPYLEWATARKALRDALNAEAAPPAPPQDKG